MGRYESAAAWATFRIGRCPDAKLGDPERRRGNPGGGVVIPALVFLLGVLFGALLNMLWDDVLELYDLYRRER